VGNDWGVGLLYVIFIYFTAFKLLEANLEIADTASNVLVKLLCNYWKKKKR